LTPKSDPRHLYPPEGIVRPSAFPEILVVCDSLRQTPCQGDRASRNDLPPHLPIPLDPRCVRKPTGRWVRWRPEGDGLRIFPGRVVGQDVVAAPWTPSKSLADTHGRVESEFVWSALDCPTIWALLLLGRPDTDERAVTAQLAVQLIAPVLASQPQIVMGWKVGEAGRARIAGGAIYSTEGRLLATAKHTLVTTDWGVPMGLNY
jgi:hypothetical protein